MNSIKISHPANEKNFSTDLKIQENISDGNGLTFRLGVLIIVSALNPIVIYENKHIYVGTTRELTLGFGKYTKYRASVEYSFIFRSFLMHHFRASVKYDIQLHRSVGEYFDDQSVISIGGGYFADKEGSGVFPEVTAGYKIGEKLLFFPYAKLRHTFMLQKNKPDITDFSIGAILGYRLF
ncbi:MAG: hypothetical protein IT281_06145 [Ignavibacteria bacterium]|nr:hypothetical protein [Ignavibacteria bacterium]